MALRKPLVIVNGIVQQMPIADVLDALLAEVDQITLSNGEASAIPIGTVVYVFAANTVKKAQANASGTADAFGLVKDVSVAAASGGGAATHNNLPPYIALSYIIKF